ncbi:MAG: hypothetical protein OEM04_09605, partial [Flavobacteriaceae bacterium]|nr:hypothetical protein [Flavobacteriaceae bacterium]
KRFTLQFVNSGKTLVTDNIDEENNFLMSNNSGNIKVSAKYKVDAIKAYDILGKILIYEKPNEKTFQLETQHLKTGTILFIKAVLENGSVINKKIIKL